VLFMMISNHYPMTYGARNGWIVLAVLSAAGVLVRRFFVLSHKHRYAIGLPVAAAVLVAGTAYAMAPRAHQAVATQTLPGVRYAQIGTVVTKRCAVCHAANPTQPGFTAAPQGVLLDTPEHVRANAQRVEQQAVTTHAMPLGNVTHMTDAERKLLGEWIAAGANI
jgi:uncharacterized membrane protein